MDENKDIRGKNKESKIVWFIYLAFIVCACVVLVRIVYIKCCFRDSDPYLKYYTARSSKVKLAPIRGNIISSDGRLLAISTPMYQIFMDCAVRKANLPPCRKKAKRKKKSGKTRHANWQAASPRYTANPGTIGIPI